jgi:hypothetical protein
MKNFYIYYKYEKQDVDPLTNPWGPNPCMEAL